MMLLPNQFCHFKAMRRLQFWSTTWNMAKMISLLVALNQINFFKVCICIGQLYLLSYHSYNPFCLQQVTISHFFSHQCYFYSNLSLVHLFRFKNRKILNPSILPTYLFAYIWVLFFFWMGGGGGGLKK